jgi:hypothetical protein
MWDRFVWRPLRYTLAETSWFGFVLNTVLIAAAVNLVSAILMEAAGVGWTLFVLILLPVVGLLLVNLYQWWRERHLAAGNRIIYNRPSPMEKRGLIVMASNEQVQKEAINYHAPQLQHVWIIVTPEMGAIGQVLEAHVRKLGAEPHWLSLTSEYDVSMCYQLVREVFTVRAPQLRLLSSQIAADMTGGTKPMTAAMVLACADLGADVLEHVPTRFVRGDPTLPLRPIQVTINVRDVGTNEAQA